MLKLRINSPLLNRLIVLGLVPLTSALFAACKDSTGSTYD